MINDEIAEGNATTIAGFGHFEAWEHKGQRVVGLAGQAYEVASRDALGIQLLGPVIASLILAYGVLQVSLGLAAGAMFILFPVAAIFAFCLPVGSFLAA